MNLSAWAQAHAPGDAAGLPAEVIASAVSNPENAFAQPAFPGGPSAMMTFLNRNLRYPDAAQEKGVQGRVMVTFWVDEQGHAYGFGALQSPDPTLAEEALRVARLMPAWTPGRQDGKIQVMMVYMPVVFKLAGR